MYEEGDVLPEVRKAITQGQVELYAKASGDYNPVHLDEEFAAGSQFGGRIAHGMMIAASISEMLTAAFGRDWPASGRLKIRFRSAVYPGETITTYGTVKSVKSKDGVSEVSCSVGVRKGDGEDAITGTAEVVIRTNG